MAEDLDDGEFWLPSQFLTDEDDLLMDKKPFHLGSYGGTLPQRPTSPVESTMSSTTAETESDEEDHHLAARLTRQIPHSSSMINPKQKERVMPGSPKSPLCQIGNWSALSSGGSSHGGSPNDGSSLVSSPPSSTPQSVKQEDPLDLLNAAAGQIGRLKMTEEEGRPKYNHGHESMAPTRRPITPPVSSMAKNIPNNVGLYSNQALIQQQLQQSYQFQQLKQLLMKQKFSAMWGRQGKVVSPAPLQHQQQVVHNNSRCGRPLGLASSPVTWRPMQQQGSGTRRESCGTGVFLPRRISRPAETRKRPAGRPNVLVPPKVVHALNLTFNSMGSDTAPHPRFVNGVIASDEHVKCHSSSPQPIRTAADAVILCEEQQNVQSQPAAASHEICLPKEWTY